MFQTSMFVPVVLGFFGLGTGYMIYGPQELLGFPARNREVDRAMGVWGIWLPGFCQFVTGIILFVGLTWFSVFTDKALYMAALAFTAYGIHWFALGWNRYQGNSPAPNAGMSVGFTILSALGAIVFFNAGVWAVGVLFCGLVGVYVSEFFVSVGLEAAERLLGLAHILTGLWLLYLTFSTTLNITTGTTLPAG